MNVRMDPSWQSVLQKTFESEEFANLVRFVKGAYASGTVFPPARLIFHAFDRTPFDRVKVVILGQDPYHEPGQAQGLAFYVPPNVKSPPSLVNIAKELASDCGTDGGIPDLLSWADQGVLLLNATLTVAAHAAGSHQGKGWEAFTDAVIRVLAQQRQNLVFILWGSYAQRKGSFIDRRRHLVIESAHPSPLSAYRGFFGSRPFSRANAYLAAHGIAPIKF